MRERHIIFAAMRHFFLLVILVLISCALSCRQQDIRTDTISVPELKNEACAKLIVNSVMKLPGLDPKKQETLTFNFQDRTVIVVYDSMIVARKNIEMAIADAGFAANDIPANPKAVAALPPECR